MNHHVNQAKYLDYCTDTKDSFGDKNLIHSLSINYVAESFANDVLEVYMCNQNNHFSFDIKNKVTKQLICECEIETNNILSKL